MQLGLSGGDLRKQSAKHLSMRKGILYSSTLLQTKLQL